jgi:predicted transcriptional regulator
MRTRCRSCQGRQLGLSREALGDRIGFYQVEVTREELAQRLKTKKTAISRIKNHAEDCKLSTLEKVAHALGKRLEVKIA